MLQSTQKKSSGIKIGFLNLAEEPGNVSKAYQMMGLFEIRFTATRMRSRKSAWHLNAD